MALVSISLRSFKTDQIVIVISAVAHLVMTLNITDTGNTDIVLFGADSLSCLFLLILTVLFLASAIYSIPFIKQMYDGEYYNHRYVPSMLFFLSSMTGVILSRNLGLMWVFVEATTLASAPLIYYHRDRKSLEAIWKYLFICSIGIALAFISVIAMIKASNSIHVSGLNIDVLVENADRMSPLWLTIAFVFAFIGFGTKMGLAPMHTWLPDAHSQSPAPASALFSGTLLNCAFLAILRYYQILSNTNMAPFVSNLLIVFGLLSIFVCAVYIIRVRDFKRKLAYSSIEHMGILSVATGLGGVAIYAAMLHTLCHSLAKHLMFLNSGNVLRAYHTVDTAKISGGINRIPKTTWLLMLGVLFLIGLPPSGIFISKFTILMQMVSDKNWGVLIIFTLLLIIIAYGLVRAVIEMAFPDKNKTDQIKNREVIKEPLLSTLPQWAFIILLVILGVHIPSKINKLLHDAAAVLGGF